jgi:uncharacterized protein
MKLPQFKKKNLIPILAILSEAKQIGFGAACCERLLPNYLDFKNEEQWGDAGVLRAGLNLAWSRIEGRAVASNEVRICIENIDLLTPQSEDYDSIFADPAQDACFAITSLLGALIKHSREEVAQIAQYSTDSVDLFVQVSLDLDPNHPNIEETILSNPLMQQELVAQQEDLNILSSSGNWMLELSNRWRNKGKGNLKILNK